MENNITTKISYKEVQKKSDILLTELINTRLEKLYGNYLKLKNLNINKQLSKIPMVGGTALSLLGFKELLDAATITSNEAFLGTSLVIGGICITSIGIVVYNQLKKKINQLLNENRILINNDEENTK